MEVRKKRPGGFKEEAQGVQVSPVSPPICFSLWHALDGADDVEGGLEPPEGAPPCVTTS
jgi:hypothetical protein